MRRQSTPKGATECSATVHPQELDVRALPAATATEETANFSRDTSQPLPTPAQ